MLHSKIYKIDCKDTKKNAYTQATTGRLAIKINNVSIFTHFFLIYTHIYKKKAVLLYRDLISRIVDLSF